MPRPDNGWNEHGGYMSAKIQKLDRQFNSGVKKQLSDIFYGVSVFIDGFTDPPDHEIKELMQLHGGKFCHYYNKKLVTHIVANTLPNSKIGKLQDEKVVTPRWIIESVEAGKLLDWSKYELYPERHHSNQNMMKLFVNNNKKDNGKEIDTGALSLSEFYAKSRLHHLSTWANELNNYFQTLKEDDPYKLFLGRLEFLDYYNTKTDKDVINVSEPVMMHIDMDCFFVSVGIRDRPDWIGKPVVVTHSTGVKRDSPEGSMSAIASCSYEARQYGIKNGMVLGKAKTLCPCLITISYNFDDYLQVAKTLYKIASRFTHDIEIGSCDELYMDLMDIITIGSDSSRNNGVSVINPLIFAEYLRLLIKTETRCPSSCGIGANPLICKLATKKAKPDGQFWLKECDAANIIKDMSVRDLPGIGWVLESKLKALNIVKCSELQQLPLDKLKMDFGSKLGQRLFDMCRGKESRMLKTDRQRKSVSAEINYGIRLQSMEECEKLLRNLSAELSTRLVTAKLTGRLLVLKIMVRHPDASVESVKFLGHGVCNNFSKSIKLPHNTNETQILTKHVIKLFKQFNKDVKDLRGVGLVMQKLEPENKSTSSPMTKSKTIANYFHPRSSNCSNDKSVTTHRFLIDDDDDNFDMSDSHDSSSDRDCTIIDVSEPTSQSEGSSQSLTLQKSCLNPESQRADQTTASVADQPIRNCPAIRRKPSKLSKRNDQLSISEVLDHHNCFDYQSTDVLTIDFLADLGSTSLERLRDAISDWISSESVPTLEDVALIRDQIVAMVSEDVNAVRGLLGHIEFCVELHHSGEETEEIWRKCYENILRFVQTMCFEEFGAFIELD